MSDLRTTLRSATEEDHRRTEEAFAAGVAALSDSRSYGAFLRAHARAFPAVGRALSFGLDWRPWLSRWHDLESDLAALDLAPPAALNLEPAASRAEALGMAYVLEGSRLGSTLLLRRIPVGLPVAYLRGGHDREPWRRLLALLGTLDDGEGAIAGARRAFGAFRDAAGFECAPGRRMEWVA